MCRQKVLVVRRLPGNPEGSLTILKNFSPSVGKRKYPKGLRPKKLPGTKLKNKLKIIRILIETEILGRGLPRLRSWVLL